jgi:2-oxoisovalerate dehydrogenase E2 component (dihydrolipoyl transacylase)
MGLHVIKMPDLGEGIAEVEVVEWRVQPGDQVVEDQVLADVMTDKATVEIPSPVHGTVVALGGAVGQLLAVGAELIRLQVEGDGNAVASHTAAVREPQVPPASAPVAAPPPLPAAAVVSAAPTPNVIAINATRTAADKPLAAPAVRQRAASLGIELANLEGSEADGRITHADLDAYLTARAPGGARAPAQPASRAHEEEAVALIGLRRKIAERMQESKRRIPHFTYVEEIDVTELEALRAQLNARWGNERGRLTLLPLLMRALVLAVPRFPQVNARFDDDAGVVTRFSALHIGIATQTESGLMVPVVRDAQARDLWSSATEIARLAEAARSGHALREELSGSTITITSLGALGGIVTTPVINYPEVAIVGVNRIVDRPVIRAGAMVARKMMNLSCSFDHRIVDGMYAAQFVQSVRAYLECPATLFVT